MSAFVRERDAQHRWTVYYVADAVINALIPSTCAITNNPPGRCSILLLFAFYKEDN